MKVKLSSPRVKPVREYKIVKNSVFISLISTLLCFLNFGLFAQNSVLNGRVYQKDKQSVSFVSIAISGTSFGTVSDENGQFKIENIAPGNYTLTATAVGFQDYSQKIEIGVGEHTNLEILLQETTNDLEEVLVKGKSVSSEKRELPYAIASIDVKPLKNQNLDVNQILNATSGIRIRESGGLGSDFNFSLNGFSGRQVRFFIDGVPMDNFGSSLSLNNIPVNLISRIEVFKGVVPVYLGSDALGGAINVVTNDNASRFTDVAYSVGSFNTHRFSAINRFKGKNGFIFNANGFLNYSDNNYKVLVEIADLKTGKYGDPEWVRRFNDAYQSQMVELEAGFVNRKFADKLTLGVIASSNHKEVQNGANMNQVAGQIYTEDKVIIGSIKYKKDNLLADGLSFSLYSNYNIRRAFTVDTSSRIYDWRGNYKTRDLLSTSGELTWYKTLFRFNDNSLLNTANLTYEIGPKQSVSLNNTYSSYTRVGEDPITYGGTPFSEPNTLNKNITGLSYSLNLFDDRWKSVAFVKSFIMNSKTFEDESLGGEEQELVETNLQTNNIGYGVASTYFLTKQLQLKVSYEDTYRLPDAFEMFGNGLLLLPNVTLTPEKSKNYNFGLLGRLERKNHNLIAEANYLYRIPENLIRLAALGVTSQYQNLTSAKANIVEGGVKYSYKRKYNIEANATYQNIINNQKLTPSGGENYLFGDRLPNQPFLFGNASAGVLFDDILTEGNTLSVSWASLFVEAFYLKWPSQGNSKTKYDIPRQVSHSASVAYSLKSGTYNVSLSCNNIFDEILFDNFMLQKPGRAFTLKARYFFNKN
ncbi:carboxypeptidase-like regulatory domain-containing protein [Jiulongibacter sp. NS-SX5]|uniref:carboxypeptidase-like regulatory domain-containing protein n=1 Tax=Jiulongibacter sp. NS-SX5 TaxID=3463854 RepID=UPI00405A414F